MYSPVFEKVVLSQHSRIMTTMPISDVAYVPVSPGGEHADDNDSREKVTAVQTLRSVWLPVLISLPALLGS